MLCRVAPEDRSKPRPYQGVEALLKSGGVKCVPIPAHSPNYAPHAERFMRTARSECLEQDWVAEELAVKLGVRHPTSTIRRYGATTGAAGRADLEDVHQDCEVPRR